MRSRLHKPLSEQFAESCGKLLAGIILVIIALIDLIARILWKFKTQITKVAAITIMLIAVYNALLAHAFAPRADASQPFQEKVIVSLPMVVHPDLKLRDTVLSLARIEFGENQVNALDNLITHESGWDPNAINQSSGACGLFQSLPCDKMKSMDIQDQIQFGFDYIKGRYDSPARAWELWQERTPHWY